MEERFSMRPRTRAIGPTGEVAASAWAEANPTVKSSCSKKPGCRPGHSRGAGQPRLTPTKKEAGSRIAAATADSGEKNAAPVTAKARVRIPEDVRIRFS